ncbi:hypothetical protein Scep_018304 [Stephania cephalantha]|uniref:Uncharacterized protein n=1 Tax=Stephania cephalantha TaxID=152367 RepID=A0AAP0ITE0_9MAGN
MEESLAEHIIGQEAAVSAISCAIRRSRTGVKDPRRPIASLLFVGPTGVGKTEVANVLAAEYFGSKEAMVRLDMSEFYGRHSLKAGWRAASRDGSISQQQKNKLVVEELRKHFRVEFLNRIDEVIIFNQLKKEQLRRIVDIMVKEVFERMKEKMIQLKVTPTIHEQSCRR